MPDGADAVLPVERSLYDAAGVHAVEQDTAVAARTHIRRAGEEAIHGDVLLPAGTVVTPPVIGLAAAAGHDTLLVTPPATVDVFVLGDELSLSGRPAPGRTRDELGPQLPAWLAAFGAAPPSVVRLSDRLTDLTTGLAAAGPTSSSPPAARVWGCVIMFDPLSRASVAGSSSTACT